MASKAFSYIRWSSRRQRDGDSLRRQLEAAEAYAAAHGLELDTTHRDEGVSGAAGKNRLKGHLARFLAAVEDGTIPRGSHLLVENLDRLTREDVETALVLFLSLTRAGITVVTLSDNRSYSSETIKANHTDLLVTMMVMARAHEENQVKGQRVHKAHAKNKADARAAGRKWTASGPMWLCLDKATGVFHFIPERITVVRDIMQWFEDGLGATRIAKRLNEAATPQFKGGKAGWTASAVRELARSRTLIGEYQPRDCRAGDTTRNRPNDGKAIADYYPAAIDAGQFHRIQATLDANAFGKGRRSGGAKVHNLFEGISTCGVCGGRAGTHPDAKRYVGLRCVPATRGSCGNTSRLRYPDIERAILTHVGELDLSPRSSPDNGVRAKLEALTGERAEAELRIERLFDDVEGGDPTASARTRKHRARIAEIDAEVLTLRATLEQTAAAVSPLDRQAAIAALFATMAETTGDELVSVRAKLKSNLRAILEEVRIYPRDATTVETLNGIVVELAGQYSVTIKGGHRMYWFRGDQLLKSMETRPENAALKPVLIHLEGVPCTITTKRAA